MRRRATLTIALFCMAGLAACGSSSHAKVSPNWDAKGEADVRAAAKTIAAKFPGPCGDFAMLNRLEYVSSSKLIHSPLPLAAGHCSALGDDVEVSAFASAKSRDDFVQARGRILCQRSAASKSNLPGLRWAVGGNISIQPDTEGVGRRLATSLGYRYVLTACTAQNVADWQPRDVMHVTQLANGLDKAGLGCADLQLEDRDLLSANDHYRQSGQPGAYAKCSIGDDANVLVGSFIDTNTPFGAFLQSEQPFVCAQSKTARMVIGTDWVVIVAKGEHVNDIAKALHGKPYGGACPASP